MNPILYKSQTCKFCKDVKAYAGIARVELDETFIEDSNPHGLRSVPAIEHRGVIHQGLEACTALLRKLNKEGKA